MKNSTSVKVDNFAFNTKHYAGWSEADFIKDQLASVPDKYGTEEQKKSFLKTAFSKIQPKSEEKPEAKKDGK